jgi:hypothetical protein
MKFFLIAIGLIFYQSNARADATTLWTQWYVFYVKDIPAGYYSEEVQDYKKDNEIHVNQHFWEKDESGMKESFLGLVAKKDDKLSPLAFYIEKKSASSSENVEGRVKQNRLSVQVKRQGLANAKPDKREIILKKDTIFSSFFSQFLALNAKKHRGGKPFEFSAVLEDNNDDNYSPRNGKAELLAEKINVHGEVCYKANLTYFKIPSIWWVSEKGKLCQELAPTLNVKILAVTEAEAKAALQ